MARKKSPGNMDSAGSSGRKRKDGAAPTSAPIDTPVEAAIPIVGIGSSAGGLEALTQFLGATPADSGMAFVLVQHLDPTQPSLMAELLQRHTAMPVMQVTDGMQIEANAVYVIAPNSDMALLHGRLHLMVPTAARGRRLPIDFLFRSLAEDQHEKAIGIILSGTGSDGTLGLRSIKGEGGMVMAQEPTTAGYAGMPQSAIATGLVDYILPAHKMPQQLLSYGRHLVQPGSRKRETLTQGRGSDQLQKIFILLRDRTGHDFSQYKGSTFNRRVERRMVVHQINRIADYVRYLQQTPHEVDTLFHELLIGVTSFFRDREEFEALERLVLPGLFDNRPTDQPFRVWVAGCSTGEEAYSLAILLREQMDRVGREYEVQIFATDIDEQAIDRARLSLYPQNIVADVPEPRLRRFFTEDGENYRISKPIRDMVIFAIHSLIKDPPFSKLDLISCRNLLIYFGTPLQKQILPVMHYALNPGGVLFLGTSESLGQFDYLFRPFNRKHKLFERAGSPATLHPALSLPVTPWVSHKHAVPPRAQKKEKSLQAIADEMLLAAHTPPAMIVDEQGEILYFHNRTGVFLEPSRGHARMNIFQMAREGLKLPLIAAVHKAVSQNKEFIYPNVKIQLAERTQSITLRIKPVDAIEDGRGLLLVVFEPDPCSAETALLPEQGALESDGSQRILELERELQNTQEYLQTTIEELGVANEELRSTVEELQSANEELQSTLEEMQTAKEELQSVNEELVTVNAELHSKVDGLAQSNADFSNLLSNIDVGIIFLDLELRIKRFNSSATRLVNLIETDIGRPLGHLVTNLIYEHMLDDIHAVLDTLAPKEVKVELRDGSGYMMRVRPYRTANDAIDGVILLFTESAKG
jgi:two-component system, chemotaxis family, CheB/CheR fusion protein